MKLNLSAELMDEVIAEALSHVNRRGKAAFSSQLSFYREAQERIKALQKIEHDSPLIPIHSAEEAGSRE